MLRIGGGWLCGERPFPERPAIHQAVWRVILENAMISSLIFSSLILLQPREEVVWDQFRMGETGLRLQLPVKPTVEMKSNSVVLTAKDKSFSVEIVAVKDEESSRPTSGGLYSEKFREFQTKHGKQIKSIMNEAPVPEAFMFRADDSIGFVLEIDAEGGFAVAWQYVRIDGWRYTLNARSSRREQALLEKMLGTIQYVDPASGDFADREIGAIGLKSYLGHAFLPASEAPMEIATSFSLQSDSLPFGAAAGKWDRQSLDFSTSEQLRKGLTQWLGGFVQGARSELVLKEMQRSGLPGYSIDGNVTIQGVRINIKGIGLIQNNEIRVVVAFVDPLKPESAKMATRLIDSVSVVPQG